MVIFWLAALGAFGLFLDWLLFAPAGSGRVGALRQMPLLNRLQRRAS